MQTAVNRHGLRTSFWFLALLTAGAALRIGAAFRTAFWSDEAATWVFAQNASSPFDILFAIRSANNHHLNTLLLSALGDQSMWALYRLPAVAFGIASVALTAHILRKRGKAEALTGTLLMSCSFMMVLYSSEARGYSMALFFGLLSYHLTEKYFPKASLRQCTFFWLVCLLGLLSHLSFVCILLGITAWVAVSGSRSRALQWIGVPLMLIVLYRWFLFPAYMGPTLNYTPWNALIEALTLPFGAPETVGGALICAAMLLLMLFRIPSLLPKEEKPFWITVLLMPVPIFLAGMLFLSWGARFLLPMVGILYLLLAVWIGSMLRGTKWEQKTALLLIALFVGMNTYTNVRFFREGRGHYREALAYMETMNREGALHIGSNGVPALMLLQYHARFVRSPIVFSLPEAEAPLPHLLLEEPTVQFAEEELPEWFIVQDRKHIFREGDGTLSVGNAQYSLQKTFRYFRESGHDWFLYRKNPEVAAESAQVSDTLRPI